MRRSIWALLLIFVVSTDVHLTLTAQRIETYAVADTASNQIPTPLARLIHALAGSWSIKISYPKERKNAGEVGSGTEFWHVGPGGNSLIEEYHSTGQEGEIFGLGIAWWDANTDRFRVVWCDSTDSAGCSEMKHGATWEGDTVVMLHEREERGKKMLLKEVFSEITENSFTQTLYLGESGADPEAIVTIHATRTNVFHPSTGGPGNRVPYDLSPINVSTDCSGSERSQFHVVNANRLPRISLGHFCNSEHLPLDDPFQPGISAVSRFSPMRCGDNVLAVFDLPCWHSFRDTQQERL